MTASFSTDFLPWLQLVVLPAILFLARWIQLLRRDIADEHRVLHTRVDHLVDAFADSRVKIAETYVSKASVNGCLDRIEDKLDKWVSTGCRPARQNE